MCGCLLTSHWVAQHMNSVDVPCSITRIEVLTGNESNSHEFICGLSTSHSPSIPPCLAPLSLTTRSCSFPHSDSSLCPLSMHIYEWPILGRDTSFGLLAYRILTESLKRHLSSALLAYQYPDAGFFNLVVHKDNKCWCRLSVVMGWSV